MDTLATRFRAILQGLRGAIATHMVREPARLPLFTLLCTRLSRTALRFEALFARWRTGTLLKPRPPRPNRPARPRPELPSIPSRSGWLLHVPEHTRLQVVTARGRIEQLLADPEAQKFLAEVPQAGRILRPLCHILGITTNPDLPAVLKLRPPPKYRPPPPPPPPYLGIIDPPTATPTLYNPLGFFAGR